MNHFFKLVIAIGVSALAGVIGSVFAAPAIPEWYSTLTKPALNPPAWVFGPVWTALYALMGISFFLVWKQYPYILKDIRILRVYTIGIAAFFIQLFLNVLWSAIFFGLQNPGWALVDIAALWLAIVWTAALFYKISKPAAYLLIPYILWVSFAGYLNFSIWQLNPAAGTGPIACTEEAKLCSDGSSVGRTGPKCEFTACPKEDLIFVQTPHAYEEISSPLRVKGRARGFWFFEASFPVRLVNENGKELAVAIATAKTDWMTTEFVDFEAELSFPTPAAEKGFIVFEKDNPSGLPENADELKIPVVFSRYARKTREVVLYYYNPALDMGASGNILCSRKGLAAVQRIISLTKTPIQDAVKLLLKGELSQNERGTGFTTEYPLEGFSLKSASLKDGTLTLEFSDPNNKTGGGACRTGILWFQIEATAKQFAGVQEVLFNPEELFQP